LLIAPKANTMETYGQREYLSSCSSLVVLV
jgi:hypothetical protein